MSGKKGMKHARPKTKEERDEHALSMFETLIDQGVLKCANCQTDMRLKEMTPAIASLMMKRYDKLRPSLSSSEVKMRVETMSDVLKRISEEKMAQTSTPDCKLPASEHVTH